MSKLDELKKRERDLLYQLEDNGKENYRTKELIETFEGYDRASHRYQSDLWEGGLSEQIRRKVGRNAPAKKPT